MRENLTPSRLRANLYRILDKVIDTGRPVSIRRRGYRLSIVIVRKRDLGLLKPHPDYLKGDRDDIVHIDWSDQWRP